VGAEEEEEEQEEEEPPMRIALGSEFK